MFENYSDQNLVVENRNW